MRIVVDSTLDVSEDLRKELTVVPLSVDIAGNTFKDGRPLEEVFDLMRRTNSFAKTSQPAPMDFERVYSRLLEETDWILSIHISRKLSGTINSAKMAAEKFRGRVFVLDSGSASIVAQPLVKTALKMKDEKPEEVIKELKKVRESIELYLTVDNLEFLKRSGRLSRAESLIGSILKLRPLIEVVDGALRTKKVYRSNTKVLKEMKKLMENAREVVIGHILNPEIAEKLWEHASKLEIPSEIVPVKSCTLSVHLGPGSYGIVVRR